MSLRHELSVALRPAIAEELPGVTHFANHIEIKIGNNQRVLVARRLRDDLSARIAKVTLAIEFADVPGHFVADPVYRADEVTISDGVGRLLQLPKVFRKSCHGCRWIENDFCAVQSQRAGAFGKMPVITDVDADA